MTSKKGDRIDIKDKSIQFKVTSSNMSDIEKAAGVLGHKEIIFMGDGEDVYLQAATINHPTSSTFSIKVGKTDKKFKGVFSTENLKIIPGDYTVTMCLPNFAHFKGDYVEYYVVLNDSEDE